MPGGHTHRLSNRTENGDIRVLVQGTPRHREILNRNSKPNIYTRIIRPALLLRDPTKEKGAYYSCPGTWQKMYQNTALQILQTYVVSQSTCTAKSCVRMTNNTFRVLQLSLEGSALKFGCFTCTLVSFNHFNAIQFNFTNFFHIKNWRRPEQKVKLCSFDEHTGPPYKATAVYYMLLFR